MSFKILANNLSIFSHQPHPKLDERYGNYLKVRHRTLNETRGLYHKEDNNYRSFGAKLLQLPNMFNQRQGDYVKIYKNFNQLYLHIEFRNVLQEIKSLHVYYAHGFNINTDCFVVNTDISLFKEFEPNSIENFKLATDGNTIESVSIIFTINPRQTRIKDCIEGMFYHELSHIVYQFKSKIPVYKLNADSAYAIDGMQTIESLSYKQNSDENTNTSLLDFEYSFFNMMYYCNKSELCAYLENIYNYLKIYKDNLNKEDLGLSYEAKIEVIANIQPDMYEYKIIRKKLKNDEYFEKNTNRHAFWETHRDALGQIYSKNGKVSYMPLLNMFRSRIETFMHKAIKIYDDIVKEI